MAEFDIAEILEAYRRKWETDRVRKESYKPTVYKCEHCKDMGFINIYPSNPHRAANGKIDTMIYCPYCRTDMLKDISGIIAEYRELDIKKFPWGTYKKNITTIKQTIESFVYDFQKWRDKGIGLYIYSEAKGSGKTMIASAICGSICTKYNIPVRFTKTEDFLNDVKRTYGGKDVDGFARENVRKYYEAELLVIDDLCVSEVPKWGKGPLHDLINERYKAKRLCIVTSNYDIDKLPLNDATVDRINDMCMLLHFPEEPIRSQKAEERKNRLKQLVYSYDKFTDATGDIPFERENGRNETR